MNGLMQYNPTPIKTRGQAIRELQAEQSGQMQNALLQMQMQNALAQQQERQQQNALMAQFRDSIPSPQMQASQAALMGGGGPTVANAQRMQPVDPRFQMADQAFRAGAMPLGEYMNMRFPAPEKPTDKVVGGALVRVGPNGVQELYRPQKDDQLPPGMRMGANGPEWIPGYLEGRERVAKAGAAGTVTMMAPIPMQNPDGTTTWVQPANRPGAQAQPVVNPATGAPGVKPGESSKPLSPTVVKSVTEARENATTMNAMLSSFKPEFANKGVFGIGADMQIGASANLGVDKDSVNWWKNYRKMAELVERHAMFGASLTVGEQGAWRSADISPGMDAAVIKRNLETRAAIAQKVLENAAQDAIDSGHSADRVGKIANRAGGAQAMPQQPQGGPKPGTVESGYRFKGGNPADPKNWEKV